MSFVKNNKVLVTLLVLVAIAAVAGLVYYFTNNTTTPMLALGMDEPVAANTHMDTHEEFDNSFIEGMTDMAAEEEAMTDALNSVQEGFSNCGADTEIREGFDSTPMDLGTPENTNQLPSDCYPKDINTAADLLPTDANSLYAQVVPNGQGALTDQNFLTAGYHIGINTVGQTLRNANRQLRSEPPNPQVKVSPWNQTTIEPDSNRRPFNIGGQ